MRHIFAMIPLFLLAGMLSAQPEPNFDFSVPAGSLYSSYRHYNIARSAGHFGRLETSVVGGSVSDLPYRTASFRWEYHKSNLILIERELASTDFSIISKREVARLGVSLPVSDRKIIFASEYGFSQGNDIALPSFRYHIRANPASFIQIDLYSGKTGEQFQLDGRFSGERIPVSFNTNRSYSGFSGKIKLLEHLCLVTGYDDLSFDDRDIEAHDRFSSLILGSGGSRYQGIRLGKSEEGYLLFVYNRLEGTGRLDLFVDGTRFGQIARLRGDIKRWKIELGRTKIAGAWKFALEKIEAVAEMSGHVESWPFTDPLVDLLGLRRNFRVEAEADIWRLNCATRFDPIKKLTLSGQLDLFRVYPDLHWADWSPVFLVFGVTDMDHYYDDFERIDFGRLNLRLVKKYNRWLIGYEISQIFPIRLKRNEEAADSGSGDGTSDGGDGSQVSALDTPRDDGGRNQRLWIGYNF